MLCIPCINVMYRRTDLKFSALLTIKFINENIYVHVRDKMCNLTERSLYEFLGFASTIILTIFFCRINIFNVKANYAPKLFHISL